MQNLTPSAPTAQPSSELTPAQKLQHAGSLIERAAARVSDEWNDNLSWSDRDRIARQLCEALKIVRDFAQPQAPPLASCLDCESVELAAAIESDQCPTCAYTFIVSH